jgi:hypothetical protein
MKKSTVEKSFVEKSLLDLAQNSFSFDLHFDYWKKVVQKFPNNKDDLFQAMKSRLFNWSEPSPFCNSYGINPLTLAISESEQLLDIIYTSKYPTTDQANANAALEPVLFHNLSTNDYINLKNIHPYLLNVVVAPATLIYKLKDNLHKKVETIKSVKRNHKFVLNTVYLYFDVIFFTKFRGNSICLDGLDFWKLIGLGYSISVDKLYKSITEPGFVLLENQSLFNDVILKFSKTGKLPEIITNKIEDSDALVKITNYLKELKTNPALLLFLAL